VSRTIRRFWVLAALALAALPLTASGAAGQVSSPVTLTVSTVANGTASGGTSVTFTCLGTSETFNFDATGAPTTAEGGANVSIVAGAWQLTGSADSTPLACELNETATGGAASTSWTCDYTAVPTEVPQSQQVEGQGCASAIGDGTGPVGLTLGSFFDVSSQDAEVTFTNTYVAAPPLEPLQPAPAVLVQPTFTG
jgi:hypothetical protein